MSDDVLKVTGEPPTAFVDVVREMKAELGKPEEPAAEVLYHMVRRRPPAETQCLLCWHAFCQTARYI